MNERCVRVRPCGRCSRRPDERGEGAVKTLLWVGLFFYTLYASVALISARSADYQLAERIEEILKYADSDEHYWKVDDVRYHIGRKVHELAIPVDPEAIEIDAGKQEWRVALAYARDIDLIFFTHHQAIVLDKAEQRY